MRIIQLVLTVAMFLLGTWGAVSHDTATVEIAVLAFLSWIAIGVTNASRR